MLNLTTIFPQKKKRNFKNNPSLFKKDFVLLLDSQNFFTDLLWLYMNS